jgi:hypothetical protein
MGDVRPMAHRGACSRRAGASLSVPRRCWSGVIAGRPVVPLPKRHQMKRISMQVISFALDGVSAGKKLIRCWRTLIAP